MLVDKKNTSRAVRTYKTILNSKKWSCSKDLEDFLELSGYQDLDCGSYAVVFGRENEDVVLKVTYTNDKCWYNFAKWAMKQKSKHLPKIYFIKSYKRSNDIFYVACMEKLKNIEDSLSEGINYVGRFKDLKKLGFVLWSAIQLSESANIDHIFNCYNIKRSLANSSLRKLPQFKNLSSEEIVKKILRNFSKTSFYHIISKINRELISKNYICFADFHSGNIMEREDGTMVITDPIATDYCTSYEFYI